MGLLPTIAIDGPVASGKTVVGRLLANRIGYRFLDTGSMYRAIAWMALRHRIDPTNEAGLSHLANATNLDVCGPSGDQILVGQCDITAMLHSPEVEGIVSAISSYPSVRQVLVEQQRLIARKGRIVVVGRDVGTVVLPDSNIKVFLQASARQRAIRRHTELLRKGRPSNLEQVLEELERRDHLDSHRAASPLRQANDAYLLNTDGMSVGQVVDQIISFMES